MNRWKGRERTRNEPDLGKRVLVLAAFFGLLFLAIAGRLFQLQVIQGKTYKLLASDQQEVQAELVPKRGTIYLQDRYDNALHPFAIDRDAWQVYALKKQVVDATSTAQSLADILGTTPDEFRTTLLSSTTSYAVLVKDATLDQADQIRNKRMPGIGVTKGLTRVYPEQGLGGQVFGFVSSDTNNHRTGKYGIEGAYNDVLAGEYGSLMVEKDAAGRQVSIGDTDIEQAKNGADVILTLDRTIQYETCRTITDAVKQFEADSGSIIVEDPNTGAILAMCSAPDFDPSNYGSAGSLSTLNNPAIFNQFEPGSIFKAITIAAGIEDGKINPQTTYDDKGEEKIDDFTIHNSDKLAHGVQTMTEVLQKSLNTGTIFVERLLGKDRFRYFVQQFGFGVKTGIGIGTEGQGDIKPLDKNGQVFAATASYGQGITTTPLQMLNAYATIANGGKLMKPYVVKEVVYPDGRRDETKPQVVRQVISKRTARLVSGMLVAVVEDGHGKKAGVPGYYVAGKTGTAQVADPNGHGYLENATIGSFVGYAPSDNPAFVMIVKVDNPKTVSFAESSAAPTFGSLAKFILSSLHVQTERPVEKEAPLPPLPSAAASGTSSTSP